MEEIALRVEERIAEAYRQVLEAARQGGLPFDGRQDVTLARMPSGLGEVILDSGGPTLLKEGVVALRGRGYGLLKILLKHGALSNKPPEFRITLEDLQALPAILREYDPAIIRLFDAEGRPLNWVYKVERKERRIIYGVSRHDRKDGLNHVATVFVEEPGQPAIIPFSLHKKG
ncbi:MAG: hypothetical protein HQL51_13000 [Magnetococcales bacterium]|nr:hypothetical protein [Magnetococcales bacterium]